MTKNPISWVTGDIQLPLLHVLTSYVTLSNTRYTSGIHVAGALGNQYDRKALPGRRSCGRRRSMVPCISGRNRSLTSLPSQSHRGAGSPRCPAPSTPQSARCRRAVRNSLNNLPQSMVCIAWYVLPGTAAYLFGSGWYFFCFRVLRRFSRLEGSIRSWSSLDEVEFGKRSKSPSRYLQIPWRGIPEL